MNAPQRPTPPPHRRRGALQLRVRADVPPLPQRLDQAGRLGEAVFSARPELEACTLVVTNNRRRVLSWRVEGRHIELSVHHAVLPCTEDVVAVALFADDGAWSRLRRRFAQHAPPAPPPAPAALDTQGAHHDLQALRDRVLAAWPELSAEVPVGWGRWPGRPALRTIRLGSCGGQPPVVRIHPALDAPEVPAWFVEFVLFHELLHVLIPPRAGAGRRVVHSAEFRRRERAHPLYAQALAWERAQLPALLRATARRAARPRPG